MVEFSTAFMVGSTAAQLLTGSRAAKEQAKIARYQADIAEQARRDQQSAAAAQAELGAYEMRMRDEQNQYLRGLQRERNLAEQERQRYLRGIDSRNEARLDSEMARLAERQDLSDQLAAERREFELERIARDDRLTQQEREFALAELQRERERARRQRSEEQARLDRGDDTSRSEYNERISRLMEDRMMREQERQFEIDRQNDVIMQAAQTRDRMRNALDQYGVITSPELMGQQELDSRAARYYDQYSAEVDAALDRSLSQKNADLIRSGMDTGGSSADQRAEILARMAPQYAKAQADAYNQAASEVGAINKVRNDRFANLRAALGTTLDAEQQVGTTALDIQSRMMPRTSGVLSRDIGSAFNPYTARGPNTSTVGVRSPLTVGSQVRAIGNPSIGMGTTINMPNLSMQGTGAAGYAAAPNLSGYDPNQAMNRYMTGMNNLATSTSTAATNAYNNAADAYGSLGGTTADFMTATGALLDDLYPGGIRFGGGDAGTSLGGGLGVNIQTPKLGMDQPLKF